MNPLQNPKIQVGAAVVGAVGAALMTFFPPNTKAHKVGSWLTRVLGGVLGGAVLTK